MTNIKVRPSYTEPGFYLSGDRREVRGVVDVLTDNPAVFAILEISGPMGVDCYRIEVHEAIYGEQTIIGRPWR